MNEQGPRTIDIGEFARRNKPPLRPILIGALVVLALLADARPAGA